MQNAATIVLLNFKTFVTAPQLIALAFFIIFHIETGIIVFSFSKFYFIEANYVHVLIA